MFSFILVAKDPAKRQEYIHNFCTEKGISSFDVMHVTRGEESIGIETIRDVQKTAFFKPTHGTYALLYFDNAQRLTLEAQNALLKILEEPPINTFIFLACWTDTFFLPTILSRCKIVVLEEEKQNLSREDRLQYTGILESLSHGTSGDKLALAEKIAGEKDKLLPWLENCITFLRENMLSDPENRHLFHITKSVQQAYVHVQTTNVSAREILEHCFLSV